MQEDTVITPAEPDVIKLTDLAGWKLTDPSTVRIPLDSRWLEHPHPLFTLNEGLQFIKSPKGTGKTHYLARVCGGNQRVLLIGHRVYLLHTIANRVGVYHYRTITDHYQSINNYPRLAICVDSLKNLAPDNRDFDTVVIDESEQVLRHLRSDTFKRSRAVVINAFAEVILRAKRIICLDADLSEDITVEIIKIFRGRRVLKDDQIYVDNTYQIGVGRHIEMYESRFQLLTELIDSIAAGRKVFVANNSLEFSDDLKEILDELHPSVTCLYVNSQTADSPKANAFIQDPSNECRKYQVVVSTPTLATGVSIEGEHFDEVYGFFSQRPLTYLDCDQAINRVRSVSTIRKVWIPRMAEFMVTTELKAQIRKALVRLGKDPEHDYEDAVAALRNLHAQIDWDCTGREKRLYNKVITRELATRFNIATREDDLSVIMDSLTDSDKRWAWIQSRLEAHETMGMTKKRERFIQYNLDNGYTVTEVPFDKGAFARGKKYFEIVIHTRFTRQATEIIGSEVIDSAVAMSLRRKDKSRTHKESLALKRYELLEWLGGNESQMTVPIVAQLLEDKVVQRSLKASRAYYKKRWQMAQADREERGNPFRIFTDFQHRTSEADILNNLARAIGYETFRGLIDHAMAARERRETENTIPISREQLGALVDEYFANRQEYNLFFDAAHKRKSACSGGMIWNSTFGAYGLSLENDLKKINGKPVRIHYMVVSQLEHLLAYLARQKAAQGGSGNDPQSQVTSFD